MKKPVSAKAAATPQTVILSKLHSDKDYICLVSKNDRTTSILVLSKKNPGSFSVQHVQA